jgi:hypothetical protein
VLDSSSSLLLSVAALCASTGNEEGWRAGIGVQLKLASLHLPPRWCTLATSLSKYKGGVIFATAPDSPFGLFVRADVALSNKVANTTRVSENTAASPLFTSPSVHHLWKCISLGYKGGIRTQIVVRTLPPNADGRCLFMGVAICRFSRFRHVLRQFE